MFFYLLLVHISPNHRLSQKSSNICLMRIQHFAVFGLISFSKKLNLFDIVNMQCYCIHAVHRVYCIGPICLYQFCVHYFISNNFFSLKKCRTEVEYRDQWLISDTDLQMNLIFIWYPLWLSYPVGGWRELWSGEKTISYKCPQWISRSTEWEFKSPT